MAIRPDLTPGPSPGRLAVEVEELPPDGIATIGQLALRVAPVVVQLKTAAPPREELSLRPTTAELFRFGETAVEIRRDQMDPRRVLVVEVLVTLEKTRSIEPEVGQVARESVSTWAAEPSTLLVEVAVPLRMAAAV
jgi:hypothetical protein